MFSHPQYTLASHVALEGVGLHTGRPVRATIAPSEIGRIEFVRDGVRFEAHLARVVQTARCTRLAEGETEVSTVEHLLATLLALSVGSVEVHVEGPEVPVLDGSAIGFVQSLRCTGFRLLPGERRVLRLDEPVWLSDNGSSLMAVPAEAFRVTVAVEYPHPLIGRQVVDFDVDPDTFEREIAPARTFGFEHELEDLARRGLAQGGSIDNALVFLNGSTTSPLRFANEPARHKALDVIGDLALLGALPLVHVWAVRPSHRLNIEFARLLQQHGTIV